MLGISIDPGGGSSKLHPSPFTINDLVPIKLKVHEHNIFSQEQDLIQLLRIQSSPLDFHNHSSIAEQPLNVGGGWRRVQVMPNYPKESLFCFGTFIALFIGLPEPKI